MTCDDFTISSHFTNIDDPRKYNIRHNLIDIITIAICALICGAENRVNVEQYGKVNYLPAKRPVSN
ncbi:MAG: transposase family protein [Deltaproteobacteria bacterium]|nr:transposase family protein [Deltaproteobacteria bacterium]